MLRKLISVPLVTLITEARFGFQENQITNDQSNWVITIHSTNDKLCWNISTFH